MKITVLSFTHRSWDMLYRQAEWLRAQTFPPNDFEWVIVDEKFKLRPDLVTTVSAPFRIIHLDDVVSDLRWMSNGAATNYGLSYASGELVFYMVDYVHPSPRTLERHWELQQRLGPAIVSGALASRSANDDASQPNQERHGDVEIEPGVWLVTDTYNKVRRFSWLARNDSAPLEAALACNGFDDRLRDLRGGVDALLSIQMVNWGCRYLIDTWPEAVCYEYAHGHEVKAGKAENLPWLGLFNSAFHDQRVWTPNERNLRSLRENNLATSSRGA